MKRFPAVAFATGLLLASSAYAEQHHDHGGQQNSSGHSQQFSPSHGSGQGSQGQRNWQGAQTWQHGGNWQSRGNGNANVQSWHGGNWHQSGQGTPNGNANAGRWNGNGQDRRRDDRANWNGGGRNFNWSQARNFRASHQFHIGSYRRPDGWYYRRWSYGEYLPAAFWAEDYWLNDWSQFDLPAPPYGCEWVRYGNDALLVNVYSGQILEVEYGVFY